MRRAVKHITLRSIAYLMLSVVGLLVMNEALFMHVHKNQGQIIAHAHPFNQPEDSKPYPSHHHSQAQFLFFDKLDLLFFALLLAFFLLMHKIYAPYPIYSQSLYFAGIILSFHGRAPPLP